MYIHQQLFIPFKILDQIKLAAQKNPLVVLLDFANVNGLVFQNLVEETLNQYHIKGSYRNLISNYFSDFKSQSPPLRLLWLGLYQIISSIALYR